MNLIARGMVAAEVSLPEVKKVDVTSWKCHRLPWNCGEKVLPEQLVKIHEVWHFPNIKAKQISSKIMLITG